MMKAPISLRMKLTAFNGIKYDDSIDNSSVQILNSTKVTESIPTQLNNYKVKHHEIYQNIKNCQNKTYVWEKHSSGVARNIIKRMGYNGKGLGKGENGIVEAIKIDDTQPLNTMQQHKKMIYIVSDSMLGGIKGNLLSKKYDVRVKAHGGCTIAGLYKHVPKIVELKPAYVIIHISTNDSSSKTSCEILKELIDIVEHFKKQLPTSEIIISTPIVRNDDLRANAIIKNLCVKIKKLSFRYLDNSNLNVSHLGQRGLHLSNHGTVTMAKNIISLIKRL